MDPHSSKLFKEDCKGRRTSPVTMIMDLSREIMSDILSRLSIKSIFCCKTVCKLWYNLLTSDPLFANMYHKRSSSYFPSLLISIHYSDLLLVELKADDFFPLKRAITLSPNFLLPPPNSSRENIMTLIGSCNGLICLLNGLNSDPNHAVFINNPLLGEYSEVILPKWEKRIRVAYAFCFSEASRQYKVLRSVIREFDGHPQLEVYTLGVDKKWRNVGQAPEPLHESFSNANVNGIVHWINKANSNRIYSFNSWTEEVKSLSAPGGLETQLRYLTLVELGNCLCLSDSGREYVDIWWMKEYGIAESWTKDRILKDSIQPDIRGDRFIPISTWKDGEILMQREHCTQVVSYNQKEKKFTKVEVDGGTAATSYIPSFYSLKSVIGESFQVSYAYRKNEIV